VRGCASVWVRGCEDAWVRVCLWCVGCFGQCMLSGTPPNDVWRCAIACASFCIRKKTKHTHTRSHTCTHTHTHTRAHGHTRVHICLHTRTYSHSHAHSHAESHSHSRSHSHGGQAAAFTCALLYSAWTCTPRVPRSNNQTYQISTNCILFLIYCTNNRAHVNASSHTWMICVTHTLTLIYNHTHIRNHIHVRTCTAATIARQWMSQVTREWVTSHTYYEWPTSTRRRLVHNDEGEEGRSEGGETSEGVFIHISK